MTALRLTKSKEVRPRWPPNEPQQNSPETTKPQNSNTSFHGPHDSSLAVSTLRLSGRSISQRAALDDVGHRSSGYEHKLLDPALISVDRVWAARSSPSTVN